MRHRLFVSLDEVRGVRGDRCQPSTPVGRHLRVPLPCSSAALPRNIARTPRHIAEKRSFDSCSVMVHTLTLTATSSLMMVTFGVGIGAAGHRLRCGFRAGAEWFRQPRVETAVAVVRVNLARCGGTNNCGVGGGANSSPEVGKSPPRRGGRFSTLSGRGRVFRRAQVPGCPQWVSEESGQLPGRGGSECRGGDTEFAHHRPPPAAIPGRDFPGERVDRR
ncbi:hypothetical protein E143388_08387 [Rhodococcus opacus]|nr:hypothetical protein E143388_08387 [Rhodococcus opacus]